MRTKTLAIALALFVGCHVCVATNLAVAKDCLVNVDSNYPGYGPNVLNDGVQSAFGSDNILAGWASADAQGEHYIQLAWTQEQEIAAVVVYWAYDGGKFHPSSRYSLQVEKDGQWQVITTGENSAPVPYSVHLLQQPVHTKSLKIVQEKGGGEAGRPDLMWVCEVEAYAPEGLEFAQQGTPQTSVAVKAGTYKLAFLSKAAGNGQCEIAVGGSPLTSVYSRDGKWTQHNLVIDVKEPCELSIRGGNAVVAQVTAEKRAAFGDGEPLVELKDLYIETPLQNAVIAAPDDEELAGLAAQVRATLKDACGVEASIEPAAAARDDMDVRTVIAIGNMMNNDVIGMLYDKGFVYADSVYPGEDGYAVRTVHNPLGAGFNVVTATGSDTAGIIAAVAKLCEHLKASAGPVLPRILDIKLGAPQGNIAPPTPAAIQSRVDGYIRLRKSGDAPEWALNNFAGYGLNYNRTGDLEWAEMCRALMLALIDFWDENGAWPMEWLWDPYWAWENVEEAPCFTDAERLRITNFLLNVGRTNRSRYGGALTARNEISNGHQLDQALCIFVLGDYFWKYYQHPEAREWLDSADWRFKTSSKYHRLTHDSNDYNHAGFWFMLRYARISGDWTYVENGEFGRFAKYTMMMLDNLGYRAQNGDAGSPFAGPQANVYTTASWYYQDGMYKWPIRNTDYTAPGEYANNIPVQEPEDLTGAFRFNIEPTYYKYLTNFDADADLPSNVAPIDMAYDKISLRPSFDPRDEYIILDGMSRGEHGHDDGNSIIRYTDNERIWLCDMDYIRRAPKWHNSAIVIRDGATEQQPPLARADHLKDFGPACLLRSTMPHYNGADWERNIFWVKNGYFVILDNFIANEAGDYRLKTIWRTLGDTEISDGMLEVRQAGAVNVWGSFKPDEDRDGNGVPDGFTASMTNLSGEVKSRSAVDTEEFHSGPASIRMECDPQGYAVIYAYWPVDAGKKYRFHTMCKTQTEPGCSASNTIFWTGANRVRLPLSQGGGPQTGDTDWQAMDIEGVAPDDAETAQVAIRVNAQGSDTANGTVWFDDLSLIEIGEDGTETVIFPTDGEDEDFSCFYIKNAGDEALYLSEFLQRGHPLKDGYWVNYAYAGPEVKTLQQVADKTLAAGENHAIANLLYTSDKIEPRDLEIWKINSTTVGIVGDGEMTICGVRPAGAEEYSVGALTLDADMFQIEGTTLRATGLMSAKMAGKSIFSSAEPIDREVTLPTAEIIGEMPAVAKRGDTKLQADAQLTRDLRAYVDGAVRSVIMADIDGDGGDEAVIGDAAGGVTVMRADGAKLWQAETIRAVNVVRAADINGDGALEVIAGGDDQKVHAYDAHGEELWAHEFEDYHSRDGKIVAMEVADIANDGNMKIVVGTEGWHWYALDSAGKQVWRVGIAHAVTAGALADLDGDGDLEIVTGSEYYSWPVYDHNGKQLWRMSGGPGVTALAVADLNGDGKQECLFGTADGAASLRCMDAAGQPVWQASLGDEPRDILCTDLNGNGTPEVVACSDSMYLYAFDGAGTRLWMVDMGDIANVLAAYDGGIIAGLKNGIACEVDSAGEIVATYDCGAEVTSLTAAGDHIIAGTIDGQLLWLK